MVRCYKKKGRKRVWVNGQLELAIQNVFQGKAIRASAELYGIPHSTLSWHIKNRSDPSPPKK